MTSPWAYTHGNNLLEVGSLASTLERLLGPTAPSYPLWERAMSEQTKPSIVFAHGIWADCSSFSKLIPTQSVGDAKGQTSVEFVRSYNAQAHEIANAITAMVLNAQAGLHLLRAQSPDLEKV